MALFRWTIGNCNKEGVLCLRESVKNISRLYPNFRRFVLFNNIDVNCLTNIDAILLDQSDYKDSLSIFPEKCTWPLYPPRIDINDTEFFIDNDVIILKKIPLIDRAINESFILSEGVFRNYGNYEENIATSEKYNSGFFSIPPNYDFGNEIENVFKKNNTKRNSHHHDFQGIVVSCLEKHLIFKVSLDMISLCNADSDLIIGKYGVHFVTLNYRSYHKAWETYKSLKILG